MKDMLIFLGCYLFVAFLCGVNIYLYAHNPSPLRLGGVIITGLCALGLAALVVWAWRNR